MRKWSILASLAIILSLTGCNILGSLFGSPEEEEFAVTYHSPDATGGYPAVDSQSYKPGANVTVAGYGTLSRDGYSPSGWRDTIRGITYTPGQSFTMPSVSVNLYIQWSGGTTYTITFDDNALDATGSTAAMNLPAGTVTLSANGFARPGYDFMGWASSSGGPKSYDDQAQFTLSANVTLYAVWQAQVTQYFISFNSNGGTGFMPAQQATGGVPVNLAANIFEAPAGFVFLGWATRADGPKVYNNQASYTGTANVSLYAYWQLQTAQQYVISFNPNAIDATGSTASITQDPGEVILSANGFVRTGYQFMGWATSSDGMVAYTDKANFLLGAANVTLYAIWELDAVDTYTIMFDPNAPVAEVSGTTGPMTAVVDKQVNLT
ncbi:MAG: InlB B-repeat-containing protein, partial [Spirochaetota bacterium]